MKVVYFSIIFVNLEKTLFKAVSVIKKVMLKIITI